MGAGQVGGEFSKFIGVLSGLWPNRAGERLMCWRSRDMVRDHGASVFAGASLCQWPVLCPV